MYLPGFLGTDVDHDETEGTSDPHRERTMKRGRTDTAIPLLLALAGAWPGVACSERPAADAGLPDSVYVRVLARLQLIPSSTDSASRITADSLRARVLAEHGVNAEQLLAFAKAVGRQPERSQAIWEEIGAAVDSIREAEGLEPPSVGSDSATTGISIGPDERDPVAAPVDSPAAGRPAGADSPTVNAAPAERPPRTPGAARGRPVAGQPVRRP